MTTPNWTVRLETASDNLQIEMIQAQAFGPGRFARTAFRMRENVPHRQDLSFVGLQNDKVAGSIRMTSIKIGNTDSLLLGPLTVLPEFKSQGLGKILMQTAMDAAQKKGELSVILVGDAPYYSPFGFQLVPLGQITVPGPIDPTRLLIALLQNTEMPTGPARA